MDLWKKVKALLLAIYALLPIPGEGLKAYALRFANDTRGASEYTTPVMMVIAGIIWVICTPIFVDAVSDTNTTGWDFTGATGAITLFQLMPFIFIAGGIVWLLKKVL